MDAIDPLKSMPLQGLPVTDEVALQVKKQVKQAKMETTDSSAQSHDVADLSSEGAKLARPQFEAFLGSAKEELLQMDPNSETYLPDATQKLVSNALEKKLGERIKDNPGYPQMEARLTSFILNDPESRAMVEELLDLIHIENSRSA